MKPLPATPLEQIPSHTASGMPRIFLKREDLLPYGGGNKVRRFLSWWEENPHVNRLGVLSDRGSHTFWTLAQMLEGPFKKSPLRSLVFFERRRAANPYVERLRQSYLNHPDIQVRTGRFLWLFSQYLKMKYFSRRNTATLGIGGQVPKPDACYGEAMEECVGQLAAAGAGKCRIWHLFPVASGNMAKSFLHYFRKKNLENHRILGILTGPRPARFWVRMKFLFEKRILLKRRKRVTWRRYQRAALDCHKSTGIWMDPRHAICAWRALARLPEEVSFNDVIVLWVTCPLIGSPDFPLIGSSTL